MKSWAVTRGPSLDPERKAARRPRRGPSDRIQHLRGHHPGRRVWRRHRHDLGSRHLDARTAIRTRATPRSPRLRSRRRETPRPLASRAHARARERAPRQLAPDQGQGRGSARAAATGHSGRKAALGRDRPLDRGDRRRQRQETRLAHNRPPSGNGRRRATFKQKIQKALGQSARGNETESEAAEAGRNAAARGKRAAKRTRRGDSAQEKRAARKAPLPDFVPLSLATLHDDAPSGPDWLHEIKFDGYRMEARLDHGKVRLLTRKQQDWTHRFKPVAEAVAALPARNRAARRRNGGRGRQRGISSFSLLQTDLKDGRTDRFVYYVFDLLYLDGRDLTGAPLLERKAALAQLLQPSRQDRHRSATPTISRRAAR